jgi:hypothetical protein
MPQIPPGAKMPTDRQPRKNEANPDEAKDVPVAFGDHEYVIPAAAFDDIEIVEQLEDENHILAVRQILGKDQWNRWKANERNPETGRVPATRAKEFLEVLFESLGALGNSHASPSS